MRSKLIIFILVLALLMSAFFPGITVGTPSSGRANVIRVNSIDIDPVAGEHDGCPYILNLTHTLKINLRNSGNTYLENINVSYTIMKMGTDLELQGYKATTVDLAPSETTDDVGGPIVFTWNPTQTDTWYVINVTMIEATIFGVTKTVTLIENGLIVSVKHVLNQVEPIDFRLFGQRSADHNNAWPSVQSQVVVKIMNTGNVDVAESTSINVEATIYNSTGSQKWTDSDVVTGINASEEISVILNQWVPTEGLWTVNMMTQILGTDRNISMPIYIQNVTDGRVVRILNYNNDSSYSNSTIEVKVIVQNSGNRKITDTFLAKLEIINIQTEAVMFGDIVQVPSIVGNNIINPGSSAQLNFSAWNASTGIKEGDYWINVTIFNGTENNGTIDNNITSITIHIGDQKGVEVDITEPLVNGVYPYDLYGTVQAEVTNTGTVTLNGFDLTLTIKDDNSKAVVFVAYKNTTAPLAPDATSSTLTFDTWSDTYNGNFTYNVTLTYPGETIVRDYSMLSIKLHGGPDWGNVTGNVASLGSGLGGVTVEAFENGNLIESTTTDTNGDYTLSYLPADTTPGSVYNVSVYKYGYTGKWNNVNVVNGLVTTGIDFDLGAKLPMGNITGTITLIEVGMPSAGPDYTTVSVSVEGAPGSTNPDTNGNFVLTNIVAGKANLSAKKLNYNPAWDTNVVVTAGENVTVDLTLIEDWKLTVTPAHESEDVATGTKIKVVFEDDINKSTVNSNSFNVTDSSGNLVGDPDDSAQLTWLNNNSFEFAPAGGLDNGETYLITLTIQIKRQTGGSPLHRVWKSRFTTLFIYVQVSGTVIDDESGNAIENANVRVGNAITQTASDGSYSLDVVAPQLNATIAASAPYYLNGYMPGNDFIQGGTYTDMDFSLKRDIKIKVSAEIGDDFVNVNHLTTLPNVDLDTKLKLEFAESIDDSTLSFTLKTAGGTVISCNLSYDDAIQTATLEPLIELESLTTYKLTITNDLENMTGVMIHIWDVTWTFETIEVIKVWSVLLNNPRGDNVALNDPVTMTFSEPMTTASVENAFSISPAVSGGTFAWNENQTSFTWTHDDFTGGETYTVQIHYTATTLFNDTANTNFTWTFTTVEPPSSFKIGPILDEDGNVIDYAEVTIKDEAGNLIWGGKTDSEGYIAFNVEGGLEPGNYSVEVSKYEYQPETFYFEVDDDGTIIPGYDVPQMKETESKEEEPVWTWIIIIILIILIVVFLVLAFMPKKEPVEEEYMEEEAPKEEPYEEELEGEEEEEFEGEDTEDFEEKEQAELDEFESEEEPFDEEEDLGEEEEELGEEEVEEETGIEGEEEEELPEDEEELPEEEEELPEEEEELPEEEIEEETWAEEEAKEEAEEEPRDDVETESEEEDEWE